MSLLIEKLQPRLVKQFQGIIQNQHLAQGYLFAGAPGTGKKELAQWLALRLFCQNLQDGKPCGKCPECQRIISGNHPDVIQIAPEKQTIKVEAIRYLKNELYKTGMEGAKRVFIIQEAEKMSVNASNSLLKFLEEPASDALIILTTTAKSQILPTIRSRMQIIDFRGIKAIAAFERFVDLGMTPANAQLLSLLTRDYQQAQTWLTTDSFNQLLKGVLHWFHKVLQADAEAFVLVQTQVVANAKTTADQQLAFEMIINFYDFLLVLRYDKSRTIENSDLNKLVTAAMSLSDQQLMTQLSLVLDIQKQLRVNVSFENVLEALTLKILAV